jgi:hypothetical protein
MGEAVARIREMLLHWQRVLKTHLADLDCQSTEPAGGTVAGTFDNILQKIGAAYPGCAFMAYGSRISGEADALSDLDILVIDVDEDAELSKERKYIDGTEIDISRAGRNVILKGLMGRTTHNQNWYLTALCDACILRDGRGEAAQLRRVADRLMREGPPRMKQKEIDECRVNLQRLADSVVRLHLRAGESLQAAAVARMRCDHLVIQSIYQFYCVRGKWTTSLQRLVNRCEKEYSELYALWLQYIHAPDLGSAVDVARLIAETVYPHDSSFYPASITAERSIDAMQSCRSS